jgi:hypothetical protein
MNSEAEPSTTRRAAVDRAREDWIRRLIDLSRRNNLLYFRDLKTSTLDLSDADPEAVLSFLQGESVPLSRFVAETDLPRVAAQVQEIRRRALTNREEKGLETLFLAMGMATWQPADEGRPAEAAVLLVPTDVEPRGREGRHLALRRRGEIQVNLVLVHVLETEHEVSVTQDSLIELLQGDDEGEAFDPQPVYARLTEAAREVKGFAVRPRLVLGNFAFQKTAMVRDLREFGQEMAQHDLIAAIAGDADARQTVQARRTEADPREIDRTPPEAEFLILNADSSQQLVVRQVVAAQDGVVHGPPGTGKSQTIANLIAELAAQGRRILFVAEKRAALEVVLERLKQAGLGHLALDLHGAEVSRREVMSRIAESLSILRETPPVDPTELHRRFVDRRRRLTEHVTRMHSPRAPSGMTVFEIQGRLLRLPPAARSVTRWRGKELDLLDCRAAEKVRDLLVEAGGFGGLFLRDDPSPWTGANLPDGASVQQSMDLVHGLAQRWPAFCGSLGRLLGEAKLAAPRALQDVRALLDLLSAVSKTLPLYSEDIFSRVDLEAQVAALAPAGRGRLGTMWAQLTNKAFREARRSVRAMRRAGPARAPQMLDEISAAAEQRRRWLALAPPGVYPRPTAALDEAQSQARAIESGLAVLTKRLVREDLAELDLDALGQLLKGLASDSTTPHRLPRLLEIEREIVALGAEAILAEIRDTKPTPAVLPQFFENAWLSSCLLSYG